MPYDPALDKELARREVEVDGQVYEVSLRSYSGAEPKVAITVKGGRFPVKRLTPKAFLAVAEAVKAMAGAQGTEQSQDSTA